MRWRYANYLYARKMFRQIQWVSTSHLHNFYYIYIRFHIESWPEWDSNPRPRAYRAHALNTELYIYMCVCVYVCVCVYKCIYKSLDLILLILLSIPLFWVGFSSFFLMKHQYTLCSATCSARYTLTFSGIFRHLF